MERAIILEDVDERVGDLDWSGFGKALGKIDKVITLTPMAMYSLRLGRNLPNTFIRERQDRFSLDRKSIEGWLMELPVIRRDLNYNVGFHCMTMWMNVLIPMVNTINDFVDMVENFDIVAYSSYPRDEMIDDELFFKGESILHRCMKWWNYTGQGNIKFLDSTESARNDTTTNYRDNKYLRYVYDYFRSLMFIPGLGKSRYITVGHMPKRCRRLNLCARRVKWLKPLEYHDTLSVIPDQIISRLSLHLEYKMGLLEDSNVKFRGIVHYLLSSRIRYFFDVIIPTIDEMADEYCERLGRYKGKNAVILFERRNKLWHYAALIAAKYLGLKTVYLDHGWDAWKLETCWWREYTRLGMFDVYVAPTKEDREYLYGKKVANKIKEEGVWVC